MYGGCSPQGLLWIEKPKANHQPTTDYTPSKSCEVIGKPCVVMPKNAFHVVDCLVGGCTGATVKKVNNGFYVGGGFWKMKGGGKKGQPSCNLY